MIAEKTKTQSSEIFSKNNTDEQRAILQQLHTYYQVTGEFGNREGVAGADSSSSLPVQSSSQAWDLALRYLHSLTSAKTATSLGPRR
jgi:hypothetical protein